jgi:hypothetical protein
MRDNERRVSVTPFRRKYFVAHAYNLREQVALFLEEENLVHAEYLHNEYFGFPRR